MAGISINRKIQAASVCLLFCILASVQSQQLPLPRPSPNATVTQTVGITDLSIKYSRPGVKGRVIWGGLVPFDQLWRTGANDATQFSCSDTVIIGGKKIPPGVYSIASIPGKDEWTLIINRNKDLSVPATYKQEEDVVRLKVKPSAGDFVERLRFTFEDVTDNGATVVLAWEKLRIAFNVEVDVQAQTLAKINSVVNWSAPNSAAGYFLQQNSQLDLAMKLSDVSLMLQQNYWNLRIKAQLLEKAGKKPEAIATMEKAIVLGKEMKNAPFDFAQIQKLLEEWKK